MKLLKQYDRVYPPLKEAETLILLKEPTLHAAIEAAGRIIIPIPGGYQCCLPEDILYLKAESNYTEINFADGSKKLLCKTLKVIKAFLPSDRFLRIHKSYVVNAAHITEITQTTRESAVKLAGGHILPVSRNNKGFLQIK